MIEKSSATKTEVLWNNSLINKVVNPNTQAKITNQGHGLFVLADDQSVYIDLRMTQDKPFWGHTHPILVQDSFSPLEENIDIQDISIESLQSFDHFEKFSQINTQTESLILTELDFLENSEKEILTKINTSSIKQIHLKDTMLARNGLMFLELSDNIVQTIEVRPFDFLIKKSIGNTTKNSLLARSQKFLGLFASHKFSFNQQIINSFKFNQNIKILGNYIFIINPHLSIEECRKSGILINENNFFNKGCCFAIPLSCTKEELLDTLSRINTLAGAN